MIDHSFYNRCHALAQLARVSLLAMGLGMSGSVAAGPPPRLLDDESAAEKFPQPAAFAQDAETEQTRSITPRTNAEPRVRKSASLESKSWHSTSLWGTIAGLFLILTGCVVAKSWLTRHGPIGLRGLPAEAFEPLGKRMLEPRVSVHLVRCGPKILLLGTSPEGIRLLTEITDPVEIDLLAGACRGKETTASKRSDFANQFRQTEIHSLRPANRET